MSNRRTDRGDRGWDKEDELRERPRSSAHETLPSRLNIDHEDSLWTQVAEPLYEDDDLRTLVELTRLADDIRTLFGRPHATCSNEQRAAHVAAAVLQQLNLSPWTEESKPDPDTHTTRDRPTDHNETIQPFR